MPDNAFVRTSYDLIDWLVTAKDLHTVEQRLADHFNICGIDYFLICKVPPPGQDRLAPLLLADRWPSEWLEYYDKKKFVRYDPISVRLTSDPNPFLWSEVPVDRREQPMAYRIMAEAGEIGMVEGFSIPIYDPSGFSGCISMCGRKIDISPDAARALHMVGLFAHGAAERISNSAERGSYQSLTEREREVLRWTAVGGTHAQIATTLGISERTVETHLRNARVKMRTTNTVHTTVVALQRREIRL